MKSLQFSRKTIFNNLKNDLFPGITVALALVPEAVAFAFVAGISPIIGLYGAFMMGIITSLFGGRPGMISGATGSMAVVMVKLLHDCTISDPSTSPLSYLFFTLLLAGLFQILAGVFRLGKFIKFIPHPVMLGFVNGLAVVIFLSQLNLFKVHGNWLHGTALLTMLSLVAVTMILMFILPKFHKSIPAALTSLVVVSLVVISFHIPTETVKTFIAAHGESSLRAGLPHFALPMIPLSLKSLSLIIPYALILAAIGLTESLMTLNLIDEMTKTKGNTNKECIAQGAANIVNGLFGGMGGCAMIGQSMINIKSGGRSRFSGAIAAIGLLCFILFASPLIEAIPIAALIGVMFMVVIGTFAWKTLRIINKIPVTDSLMILLVTVVTIFSDLAIAVLAGVIISALSFAWKHASTIKTHEHTDSHGIKHYELFGSLFFGSASSFHTLFELEKDPQAIIIDFKNSNIADHSALEAIHKLSTQYRALGKTVHLKNLSTNCLQLIEKAKDVFDIHILKDENHTQAINDYRAQCMLPAITVIS